MKNILLKVLAVVIAIIFTALCLELFLRIINPLGRTAIEEVGTKRSAPLASNLPTTEKAADEIRVLALGDSFTWGDGIEDVNKIWTGTLEEKLNSAGFKKKIKVINMGMCGLTTFNELELLLKVGQKLNPDLVIVQFLVNDTLPSAPGLKRVGEDWLYKHPQDNVVKDKKMHELISKKSYLYDFVNDRYLALQRKLFPPMKWEDLYKDDFVGFVEFKKALSGFKFWQDKNNAKVIFVLFPNLPNGKWTIKTFPYSKIYAKVERVISDAGLESLDLLPFFVEQGKDFSYWHVSKQNSHPNAAAHRMMGEKIAEYVEQKHVI